MAIEINKAPSGSADAGMFNLPPKFDVKKYASMWVEESQVSYMQQRQVLTGTNKTADGWVVWKNDKLDNPTTVKSSGGKKFVLMCRSRKVQDEANAIFGNVSKEALNREITGSTVAGGPQQDPGILTERQLSGVDRGGPPANESVLPLNEEATAATT